MKTLLFQGKSFVNAGDAWYAAKAHYLQQGRKNHDIPSIIANRHPDIHRAYVNYYNGVGVTKLKGQSYIPAYFS